MAKVKDDFWSRVYVPVNQDWEENNVEFVNPVIVADMFAEATGIAARLAQQAEDLTSEIANFEFERAQVQRDLTKLRRELFATNYDKITKSAGAEIQDAFVLAMAQASGKAEYLLSLEKQIDDATTEIWLRTPRLDKLKHRLKVLEKNMEWAKQYLDYDKLLQRVTSHNQRS